MRILTMLSAHPGSGQNTVLVNLASGLARRRKRVLIGHSGPSQKLLNWLGVTADAGRNSQDSAVTGTLEATANQIRPVRFGLDFMPLPLSEAEHEAKQLFLEKLHPLVTQLGYAYLILNLSPIVPEAGVFIPSPARVLVCTDLRSIDEVAEIEELQRKLQVNQLSELSRIGKGSFPDISLIIPNRINPKEWVHNNEQLGALGERFGYEKLADPLPT